MSALLLVLSYLAVFLPGLAMLVLLLVLSYLAVFLPGLAMLVWAMGRSTR